MVLVGWLSIIEDNLSLVITFFLYCAKKFDTDRISQMESLSSSSFFSLWVSCINNSSFFFSSFVTSPGPWAIFFGYRAIEHQYCDLNAWRWWLIILVLRHFLAMCCTLLYTAVPRRVREEENNLYPAILDKFSRRVSNNWLGLQRLLHSQRASPFSYT